MSTLQTDTIENTSGGPVALTDQIAAQAAFNYNQSISTLHASFNLSSMVDDGTGLFTSSFTNVFADANQYVGTHSVATRYVGLWVNGASLWQFSQRAQSNDAQSEAGCTMVMSGDLA